MSFVSWYLITKTRESDLLRRMVDVAEDKGLTAFTIGIEQNGHW